jgi:heat-inducible transcriptional repressor
MSQERTLTARQRDILRWVVREHVETGKPVGSKTLVERGRLPVSSSTVRSELAELEHRGLLTHPHTSAGRIPTERGYRLFAAEVLERVDPRPGPFPLDLSALRSEVDSALQATSERLAEATRLLALVSAPPLETTTIRHVEVLLLQPTVVVVVVITSTGGVTKHIVTFEQPVDPGLASWAREFLNERAEGLSVGSNVLRQRFSDPELDGRERAFLEAVAPAFSHSAGEGQRLFVGGTAGALDEAWAEEPNAYRRVLEMLERRAVVLEMLRDALDPRGPFVRVGREFRDPSLRDVALVGASYGLANRTLGVVSLLGPLRMDYAKAIDSVRGAARALSSFVEEVYSDN